MQLSTRLVKNQRKITILGEFMLNIALYQQHNIVGNIKQNFNNIKDFYTNNITADLLVTPELSLTGYTPQDALLLPDFASTITSYINQLKQLTQNHNNYLVVGSVYYINTVAYNCALVFNKGELCNVVIKQKLPNYGVFNEHRFFKTTATNNIITIKNVKVALAVCEDLWHPDFVQSLAQHKPNLCISINASPFEITKHFNKSQARVNMVTQAINTLNCPVIYLNTVGGFDEVVFDGASFIQNPNNTTQFFNSFAPQVCLANYNSNTVTSNLTSNTYSTNYYQLIYQALMLGLCDFINNNKFKGVLLALSGGIDSALTAALVCDALGSNQLKTVFMPSAYSNPLSLQIATTMQQTLGFSLQQISINSLVQSYASTLSPHLQLSNNTVMQNLQARIRGQIIMAYANNYNGYVVLTTGNKSEVATGYCTLYGDTAGAFNLLKDLYKTDIYEICKWRNNNIPHNSKAKLLNVLPTEVISRKPSAELADNQFDEDNLMPYAILDEILYNTLELNRSVSQLNSMFNPAYVTKALNLLHSSHHKRIQSAIGIKVSKKAFGKDYNYPLTTAFNPTTPQ